MRIGKSAIYVFLTSGLLAASAAGYFYWYNYVQNTPGQARTLRLPGLREFICKGDEYVSGAINHCGNRSIYKDADWGITAYYDIYGIETKAEAELIAKFMAESRDNNRQQHIPIHLDVFSSPRSYGARPSDHMILSKDF
jgi:hypothetical protein